MATVAKCGYMADPLDITGPAAIGRALNKFMGKYAYCYTIVLPFFLPFFLSFLICDVSVCLSYPSIRAFLHSLTRHDV
jgi:hypothetical protein